MSLAVTRRSILQVLASIVSIGITGCLSTERTAEGGISDQSTTTQSEPAVSADSTRSTETSDSTVPGWEDPEPRKDHDVTIESFHDQTHTIDLAITHDGEVLFEDSFELSPGEELTPYNFLASPIDGIADYSIEAQLEDGQTASTTFTTDSCHGEVVVIVEKSGTLSATYSIC